MDERYAFLGHEICSSDPCAYDLTSALPPGEQFLDTSQLFHPNVAGLAQMAADLGAYWQALQSEQTDIVRGARRSPRSRCRGLLRGPGQLGAREAVAGL
jgi:hypothetical protein